jgi:hypothetical protein
MMSRNIRRGAIVLAVLLTPGTCWFGFRFAYTLRPLGPLPRFTGQVEQASSKDWAHIYDAESRCVLQNNVWNKPAGGRGFEQEVFLGTDEGNRVVGWRWRSPWQLLPRVVSQPELVCGDKPWDEPQHLNTSFPLAAGSRRITADFDIKLHGSGTYNMAFSLWAVSALPVSRSVISHEIMIWNANSGQPSAGTRSGTLDVAGTTYDVYVEKNHKDASGSTFKTWTYVAFIARRNVLMGPLDLSVFVDWLLEHELLSRNHYLTSVELGDEVCQGTGIAEIQNFSIKVH